MLLAFFYSLSFGMAFALNVSEATFYYIASSQRITATLKL